MREEVERFIYLAISDPASPRLAKVSIDKP